jgi:hypothetical protein
VFDGAGARVAGYPRRRHDPAKLRGGVDVDTTIRETRRNGSSFMQIQQTHFEGKRQTNQLTTLHPICRASRSFRINFNAGERTVRSRMTPIDNPRGSLANRS